MYAPRRGCWAVDQVVCLHAALVTLRRPRDGSPVHIVLSAPCSAHSCSLVSPCIAPEKKTKASSRLSECIIIVVLSSHIDIFTLSRLYFINSYRHILSSTKGLFCLRVLEHLALPRHSLARCIPLPLPSIQSTPGARCVNHATPHIVDHLERQQDRSGTKSPDKTIDPIYCRGPPKRRDTCHVVQTTPSPPVTYC